MYRADPANEQDGMGIQFADMSPGGGIARFQGFDEAMPPFLKNGIRMGGAGNEG
jgi:hypothetical protein